MYFLRLWFQVRGSAYIDFAYVCADIISISVCMSLCLYVSTFLYGGIEYRRDAIFFISFRPGIN